MSKNLNLNGKSIFISGANRGIGKAILEELVARGASKIYAGARNTASLKDLVKKYGDTIEAVSLDVTDSSSISKAAAQVGSLDVLVNNAGVFATGPLFSDRASESMKQNLNVNVWGVFKLTKALVDKLNASDASAIINISSLAGLGNMPMAGTYSISKAAVHSMTQGMRAELANTLVMGVYPGPIDTDMAAGLDMEKDSADSVAKAIANGLENGIEDVYPDTLSQQIEPLYASNPKGVEQQFAMFI